MSQFVDLTGQTLGHWAIIGRAENGRGGQARWVCQCVCGAVSAVSGAALRAGRSRSCGCLQAAERQVKRRPDARRQAELEAERVDAERRLGELRSRRAFLLPDRDDVVVAAELTSIGSQIKAALARLREQDGGVVGGVS